VIQPLDEVGIDIETLGKYMTYQRVLGDRSELANPGGHTPRTARDEILKMRLNIGMYHNTKVNRVELLDRAVKEFHDIVFEVIQDAVEVGSYSRERFEKELKPNRYHYATFAVVEYLQDFVPAGLSLQKGTHKQIANPAITTIMKMEALNRLNSLQRTKRSWIATVKQAFPDEIKPAKVRWTGKRMDPVPNKDYGVLMVLEDGSRTYHYVDPFVAEAFEKLTPPDLAMFVEPLNWTFKRVFYPFWIKYNASFHVANMGRDFARTSQSLKAVYGSRAPGEGALAREYARVLDSALKRVLVKDDPLIKEMLANFAISLPDEVYGMAESDRGDFLQKKLEQYKILPVSDSEIAQVRKSFQKGLSYMTIGGTLAETISKIATYKLLRRDLHESPSKASAFVRNYAGTPNIRNRGKYLWLAKPFIPFWNVYAQGFRADAALAMAPTTASGWWMRWFMRDGIFAVFQAMASAGLFGYALKKAYDAISEYNKTNYNNVAFGFVEGGDFEYEVKLARLPRPESSRLLSGITYKLVSMALGNIPKSVTDVAAFGAGQTPGLNPLLNIAYNWATLITGGMPFDRFKNRAILTRDERAVGGWAAAEPMLVWTYNQTGLQDFYRIDPQRRSTTQATLNSTPFIHRFITTTDYGLREKQAQAITEKESLRAATRLGFSSAIRENLGQYYVLSKIPSTKRTEKQQARYAVLSTWYNRTYLPHVSDIMLMQDRGMNPKGLIRSLETSSKGFALKKK
jgi:hypothetical protein